MFSQKLALTDTKLYSGYWMVGMCTMGLGIEVMMGLYEFCILVTFDILVPTRRVTTLEKNSSFSR